MSVWNTENKVKVVFPSGSAVEREQVNAEDLKALAREHGIKKFTVENSDGDTLTPSDFPVTEGTIYLKEYNEAKSDVWGTEEEGGVTLLLPGGESRQYTELSGETLKAVAREKGIKKFTVTRNGETLTPGDFPVTSGEVVLSEYNEAKGDVWESEQSRVKIVLPSGSALERSEVAAEDLKSIAREHGIKKFTVENSDGDTLTPSDFPVTEGTIYLKEYNEAKQ